MDGARRRATASTKGARRGGCAQFPRSICVKKANTPGARALIPACRASLALAGAFGLVLVSLLSCAPAHADLLDAQWNEGSPDCAGHPGPALEVRRYDIRTFILREGLCTTSQAPFMYLLIGSERALLIDTGAVDDPAKVPLARAVEQLLPGAGPQKLPLLVVHTDRRFDHRAGDGQLMHLPNTQVVGTDLASIESFYGLPVFPYGRASLNLGERAIDVIPTPGHDATGITFYDRGTGLVFCGDFLLPGRIIIDDIDAYRESVDRLIMRLGDWRVTAILGGHIEQDAQGQLYSRWAAYHPHEHPLPMTLGDLKALSVALDRFNGYYTHSGGFTMSSPRRILTAVAVPGGLAALGLVWAAAHYLRRRRGGRGAVQAVG